MTTEIWINTDSCNGLVPASTKPLHEPMLTYHQISNIRCTSALILEVWWHCNKHPQEHLWSQCIHNVTAIASTHTNIFESNKYFQNGSISFSKGPMNLPIFQLITDIICNVTEFQLSISVKISQQGKSEGFDSCDRPSNLKLDSNRQFFRPWPCKTKGHLFYATSSFVHHFVAIGEFKLELQSGNAQSGSNSTIFRAMRPWNLTDDLAKQ